MQSASVLDYLPAITHYLVSKFGLKINDKVTVKTFPYLGIQRVLLVWKESKIFQTEIFYNKFKINNEPQSFHISFAKSPTARNKSYAVIPKAEVLDVFKTLSKLDSSVTIESIVKNKAGEYNEDYVDLIELDGWENRENSIGVITKMVTVDSISVTFNMLIRDLDSNVELITELFELIASLTA